MVAKRALTDCSYKVNQKDSDHGQEDFDKAAPVRMAGFKLGRLLQALEDRQPA